MLEHEPTYVAAKLWPYLPVIVDGGGSIVDNGQVAGHTVAGESLEVDTGLDAHLVLECVAVARPLGWLAGKLDGRAKHRGRIAVCTGALGLTGITVGNMWCIPIQK